MDFDRQGSDPQHHPGGRPQPPARAACPGPHRRRPRGCPGAGGASPPQAGAAPGGGGPAVVGGGRALLRPADAGGGELRWLRARAVVLATGGGGHLYANTTNPSQASGDGLAMAWQAGAVIRDLEFVQFHPTALMLPGAPHFLISEAVRGEGARLLDGQGTSPVAASGAGGDLAPREPVSRALARWMRQQGVDHLWLDLRPIGRSTWSRQFPTILGRCRELGLEPTSRARPGGTSRPLLDGRRAHRPDGRHHPAWALCRGGAGLQRACTGPIGWPATP